MTKKEFGLFGEEKAAEYLKKKGYRILERNFSCKLGEVAPPILIQCHSNENAVKPLISRGLDSICSSHIHKKISCPIKKRRSAK